MWFLTPDDLRDATGFENAGDLQTSALEAALDAATVRLGAELQTSFDRATRTEVFFVTRSMSLGGIPTTVLLLGQGFVSEVTGVGSSARRAEASVSGSAKDLTDFYVADLPRGRVTVQDWDLSAQFAAVTYSAGFAAGTGDTAKLYQDAPPDLVGLAQQAALIYLDSRAPQMRHAKDNPPNLAAMESQLTAMLRNYRRGGPGLIRSQ